MSEQRPHVHEFGPPKLAAGGAGGSFRQCVHCSYYNSVAWANGYEQGWADARDEQIVDAYEAGKKAMLAELRAKGVPVVNSRPGALAHGNTRWSSLPDSPRYIELAGDALGMEPGKRYLLIALERGE